MIALGHGRCSLARRVLVGDGACEQTERDLELHRRAQCGVAENAARYEVQVNGEAVAVRRVAYNVGSNSVMLNLATSTLQSGDTIVVSWIDLRDAKGALNLPAWRKTTAPFA